MSKTEYLGLNLTTDESTSFSDWRKSIDGEGEGAKKSNMQLIDEQVGGWIVKAAGKLAEHDSALAEHDSALAEHDSRIISAATHADEVVNFALANTERIAALESRDEYYSGVVGDLLSRPWYWYTEKVNYGDLEIEKGDVRENELFISKMGWALDAWAQDFLILGTNNKGEVFLLQCKVTGKNDDLGRFSYEVEEKTVISGTKLYWHNPVFVGSGFPLSILSTNSTPYNSLYDIYTDFANGKVIKAVIDGGNAGPHCLYMSWTVDESTNVETLTLTTILGTTLSTETISLQIESDSVTGV